MTNPYDSAWPADGPQQPAPDEPTPALPDVPEQTFRQLPDLPDPTRQLPDVPEPTRQLPDVPEPTRQLPDVPDPTRELPAFSAPAGAQQPPAPYGYGGYVPGPATHPSAAYGPPASGTGWYSPQAYAPPGQGYPPPGQGYPPPGQTFAAPGQSYPAPGQGYPQHPGYYQPGQYYGPPTGPAPVSTVPSRRWPLALVALLVAVVLGGSSFLWAAGQLTGASSFPTATTAPSTVPQPSAGQSDEPDEQGTTTGNVVAASESAGVVLIAAETSSGRAAGTGMVLSASGEVLTNYHVVAGSEAVEVTIADTGDTYVATVVGFDQSKDVALLQLQDASGLATVRIDTTVPSVGAEVAAVGNAEGGGELVKAPGAVTDTDQDLTVSSDSPWGSTEDLEGLIETSARAVPGDSGGPMFDADDEVIGMTTAGSIKERTSYAVPIATALAVVEQVETGQDAGTVRVGPAGFLGIKVAEADADADVTGKTITAVVEGSPAEAAGVKPGSRLTRVGDTTIRASTNLATVIRALEPGAQVSIEWTAPNGTRRQATVTLDSSPVN